MGRELDGKRGSAAGIVTGASPNPPSEAMRGRVLVGLLVVGVVSTVVAVPFVVYGPFAREPRSKTALAPISGVSLPGNRPPLFSPDGCNYAHFTLDSASPKAGQVFHDGDELRVTISYTAPGCSRVGGYIFGYFTPHTPWFDFYCKSLCEAGRFSGNIRTQSVSLPAELGSVTVPAAPGPFPPPDLASPPNLEGFVFCGVVLTFDNGSPSGYNPLTEHQLDAEHRLDAGCNGPSY
jgi:hypothetical protein